MGEEEERITTPEVGILTLINKKLREMLELQKQQIPEGVAVNFEGTVTATTLLDLINTRPYRPLFSADVYNGGPNNLYVKINDGEEVTITSYRTKDFDYTHAKTKIRKIQLRVATNESASYEILGIY